MIAYWVSWYGIGSFEYDGPHWVSGWAYDAKDHEVPIHVAAVMAESPEAAKEVIIKVHDDVKTAPTEFRFVEERVHGWQPFCGRFPRAGWMKWPYPEAKA